MVKDLQCVYENRAGLQFVNDSRLGVKKTVQSKFLILSYCRGFSNILKVK